MTLSTQLPVPVMTQQKLPLMRQTLLQTQRTPLKVLPMLLQTQRMLPPTLPKPHLTQWTPHHQLTTQLLLRKTLPLMPLLTLHPTPWKKSKTLLKTQHLTPWTMPRTQ